MTDAAIIASIKTGDNAAIQSVYNRHRDMFVGYFIKKFHIPEEEAISLYTDSILIFIKNVQTGAFQLLENVLISTYLLRIGINIRLREVHRNQRWQDALDVWILELQRQKADRFDPWEGMSRAEMIAHMKKVLAQLDSGCQKILNLYYYEEQGHDEIANAMGYDNHRVSITSKARCIQRLRAFFVKSGQKDIF
jgi:DNA-directed RNA polymerase specialized sigma24 family protein